jgi:tRNA-binding EMAP/Myf-like protein
MININFKKIIFMFTGLRNFCNKSQMIGTKVMAVMPPFCIIMDDGTVTQVYYKIQLSFLLDILLEKYHG